MTQIKKLLVVNAGSSSLKFAVFTTSTDHAATDQDVGDQDVSEELRGQIAGIGQDRLRVDLTPISGAAPDWRLDGQVHDHITALHWLSDRLGLLQQPQDWLAIGHRVVHGGTLFTEPLVLRPTDIAKLESLIPLAPLHQPHNVGAIKAMRDLLPDVPQVACFDTGFHAGNPERVARFALPERYWQQGIRRYGFHGLSYEAILARLRRERIEIPPRLIIAHLGNGASMAAIRDGVGLATSMSFSTLDGLIMGTRPGGIDPGVLLYLLRQGMSLDDLERLLYHESGLLGLSGLSADMKTVSGSDDPQAKLAIDLYCHRIAVELGRFTAELQGLDMLIFTGGVGENASEIRARVVSEAGWLGVMLDQVANERARRSSRVETISSADAGVSVLMVPTDEEGVVARHCLRLLASR